MSILANWVVPFIVGAGIAYIVYDVLAHIANAL